MSELQTTDELLLSGATDAFSLGDDVTLLGHTFKLRSHTNPELSLYDALMEQYGVYEKIVAYGSQAPRTIEGTAAYDRLTEAQTELIKLQLKENPDKERVEAQAALLTRLSLEYEAERAATPLLKRMLPRYFELESQVEAASDELLRMFAENVVDDQRESELNALLAEYERMKTVLNKERIKVNRGGLNAQMRLRDAEEAVYTEFVWHLWKKEYEYKETLPTFRDAVKDDYVSVQKIMGAMNFGDPIKKIQQANAGLSFGIGGTTSMKRRASPN